MDLGLRPATGSDLDFLVSLRRETMWVHFEKSGVPVDEIFQRDRVLHRFDCAQIVTLDGEDIGMLKVARDMDPWELIQIMLRPSRQRLGIGEQLVRGVLADARHARRSVALGVLRANPAKQLYERLGFAVVGTTEHGFLMRYHPTLGDDP